MRVYTCGCVEREENRRRVRAGVTWRVFDSMLSLHQLLSPYLSSTSLILPPYPQLLSIHPSVYILLHSLPPSILLSLLLLHPLNLTSPFIHLSSIPPNHASFPYLSLPSHSLPISSVPPFTALIFFPSFQPLSHPTPPSPLIPSTLPSPLSHPTLLPLVISPLPHLHPPPPRVSYSRPASPLATAVPWQALVYRF